MKDLLKIIRESRNLRKIDVYNNIVSKDLYNRIEEDLFITRIDDLILILERLELSLFEFSYVLSTYISDTSSDLIKDMRSLFISSNNKELERLINKYKSTKPSTYYLLLSIKAISDNNLDEAHEYASQVWEELKDYDTFYPHDVFYLSHIFYLFPMQEGLTIIDILKKQLSYWREYDKFMITETGFYLNAGRYIQEVKGKNEQSIEYYYKALELSLKNDLARYTGIAFLRIGHLEEDNTKISNGKTILNIFEPRLLTVILTDIEHIKEG